MIGNVCRSTLFFDLLIWQNRLSIPENLIQKQLTKNMRTESRTFQILSLLLVIITVSCSTSSIEDFVVGDNFINDQTGVVMIDTLTVQSSTVKYDSIYTNSAGRILVGSNYNNFSGYKSSNSFFTMKFDDAIDDTEFVFDSLCLILNYDTYYSGDTTVSQTLSIHQLEETLELDENSYLYSTSKFDYSPTPLGSIKLKPRPNSGDELSIRLSDKLGERLTQMIKDKKDTITSQELFLKFFKGIVIKAQPNVAASIFGFSITSASTTDESTSTTSTVSKKPEFRLYYHLSPNPDDKQDLYYKFSFISDGVYYNQISGDSSGSLLDGIELTNNEKSSTLTGNNLIIQSGIQTFAKLRIPYIDNLLKIGQNSAMVGATMRLYPVKGTYVSTDDLPDSLYVYSADRKNNLIDQIYIPGSTSEYAYARLNVVKDVEETVYYEVDLSSFVESELAEELETNLSLMIGYSSTITKKTAEQVILGGAQSTKYSPNLNVYYYHN